MNTLGFPNPVYRQETGELEQGRLVPSLRRGASTRSIVSVTIHQEETGLVGYDQSEQLPPDPATKTDWN